MQYGHATVFAAPAPPSQAPVALVMAVMLFAMASVVESVVDHLLPGSCDGSNALCYGFSCGIFC
jgi:uncharacterized protein (DUF779 family)